MNYLSEPCSRFAKSHSELSFDDRQDVFWINEEEFEFADFDFVAAVLGEKDAIALFHPDGDSVAGLHVELAIANGFDDAGDRLLLSGLGQVNAHVGLCLCLIALDEDLVAKGLD